MQRLVARWSFAFRMAHSQALRSTMPVLMPEGAVAQTEKKPRKDEKPLPPVTEMVQMMHDELLESLKKKQHFPTKLLEEMFGVCKNYSDVKLGLHVLDRLRKARAAHLSQFEEFDMDILKFVVRAFVRVRKPSAALEAFTKYNPYGLYPNIDVAHELLKYATMKNDPRFTRSVLKYMLNNSIRPTADTAVIIMEQCKRKAHVGTLLLLAKEFHANGIKMYTKTYDILLSAAANSGRLGLLEEIVGWRKQHNIRDTISSTFSVAKARLLKGKPEEAASIIVEGCKEHSRMERQIAAVVKVWPVDLVMSHTGGKKSAQSNTVKTKKTIETLLECLAQRGHKFNFDMEKDFGSADGFGDKFEFVFGKREAKEADADADAVEDRAKSDHEEEDEEQDGSEREDEAPKA